MEVELCQEGGFAAPCVEKRRHYLRCSAVGEGPRARVVRSPEPLAFTYQMDWHKFSHANDSPLASGTP